MGSGPSVQRYFSVEAFQRTGTVVTISTDASPWGMGGYLTVNGHITHFSASPITQHDINRFKYAIWDAAGQQLWESLAILVAIGLWSAQPP